MTIGLHLAIVTATLVVGFAGGNAYQSGVSAKAELIRQETVAKTMARQADRIDTAAVSNEVSKEATRIKFININKKANDVITQNTIYRDVCFDDAGLQQLNTAIGESTSTSESITPLPSVKQTE